MNQEKQFELGLDSVETMVQEILTLFPEGGVIGLSGELGSGKTTFVRTFIQLIAKRQGISIGRVVSPSFVLHQGYEQLKPIVHHYDLYRINLVDEATLIELEYYEILNKTLEQKGFVFIEWPEMCPDKAHLKLTAHIHISIINSKRRYLVKY